MDRAADIFGPDCSHLKGTSTRPHTPRVRSPDVTEIPHALRTKISPLILCLDAMCVNGMPMLTTVDSCIKYITLVLLKNRTAKSLYDSPDNVLCHCNRATIYVSSIDSDIEFKSLFKAAEDNMDAKFNCTLQGEHVPAAERNNRTTADHIPVAVHYLPYRNIPHLLLKHIAVSKTEKLNWFPAKGGLSNTFTPHQFLELPPIDWNKDLKILQGSYCQAFTERTTKNEFKQRTLDTLFLAPMKNKQGGYVMLNLAINKEVTSTRITQVPITDLVVRTVEELAAQDGMTPLKIENRTCTVIYNNGMLPAIDHEEDTEPVTTGHNPNCVPRPQRSHDNELSNERNCAPITSSELDDLRADADDVLPARLPRCQTTADTGDAPVPAPTRRSPSPPPVTTRSGRSACPVTRFTPAHNQVLNVPTPKQVRIAPT